MGVADTLRVDLSGALADALRDQFEALMDYIQQRLAAGDDIDTALAQYGWPQLVAGTNSRRVLESLARAYTTGATAAAATIGVTWGASTEHARIYAQTRAAEMVGMRPVNPRARTAHRGAVTLPDGRVMVPHPDARWAITDDTRDAVRAAVAHMMDIHDGSYRDLKAQLEAMPAFPGLFGEYRAEMIARTELALAQNQGAVGLYASQGVKRVRVLDNPDCAVCRLVADTTQTVDWAAEHPIGHPNCIRAFQPID